MNFNQRKEKILWPLFEFKRHSPINLSPEELEKKKKKIGFNLELFNNIESVRKKNDISPIYIKNRKLNQN